MNNNNTVRATADLALTKTDGAATVNVGASTTYTITVTNNGPDIEPAGIIISDTIPAGTNASETEADCTITAGVFRCTTVTPLAVGASRSYQLTLALPAAYAAATLVNTATITTFPIPDPVAANNTSTDTDTVPQANLSITKTDSVDPVNPGQAVQLHPHGQQRRPVDRDRSDRVGHRAVAVHGDDVTSPIGSCGNVGNVVTCTLASMASGAPAWVITVNVTAKTTTPGGTYVNTATVSAASPNDPALANNTANNNNTVTAYGDLVLTKTDGTATVTAGTSTTYTITITNNGPSTEPAGVRFTDTIPAGTVGSEAEADCAIAAGVFTCTTVTTIAAGASRSYQLTLAVPSGYVPATVVNTANITIRPIVDPDLTNNSASDTDTVVRSANLSITKTDSADPVVPGQAFTYTLTVANGGPVGCRDAHRLGHGARAVHRDERDVARRLVRLRRPGGHVHAPDARQRRDMGDHGLRDDRGGPAGGHVHEHGHRERRHVRPGAGQQLRVADHDHLGLCRPRRHEDRRRGVGGRRHLHGLHHHADEQRTVRGRCRRRRLGPDPRGDRRIRDRAELRHRGGHVHVHDDGRAGIGRLAWSTT